MVGEIVKERLKELPNRPGCYLMRDRRGAIIYVGKAKNLKKRVSQYFRPGARHAPKVRSMVNTVWDFEFIIVKNEVEALLTESELIKKHKPRFNILMRDDKRYLSLRADTLANWPYFSCCRIIRDDGALYFGPFPSSPVVRIAKDFVEKRWGIRGCNHITLNEECHKHCNADVIRSCAAPCLGKISLEEYKSRFDEACAFLRGDRPKVLEELEEKMQEASVSGDFEMAARWRDTIFALKEMTKSHFVRRTPKMRQEDAKQGLKELASSIGLEKELKIIECVDISNLFGTHSVASLVVAKDGLPDGRWYRYFKIKTVVGADDPRSMEEVVIRRYGPNSTLLATSPKADLFVCDGGITQLRAARRAFASIGLSDMPVIALAEKQEEIVLDDGRENLILPRDSEALFVLTRLRDEAHRFAISHHRRLRGKTIRESILDEIPGIGEAKKTKLLSRFGSIKQIARANAQDVAHEASISLTLAEEVIRVAKGG
ncbi:MAG: excinuclease ABC subunit UvrC [Kiritimatiellae bacterium]|nr:excinuclease ABC subunit UvrC [Kiritimatiellia bacterium]